MTPACFFVFLFCSESVLSEAIDNMAKKIKAEIDCIETDRKIIAIMLTMISALWSYTLEEVLAKISKML